MEIRVLDNIEIVLKSLILQTVRNRVYRSYKNFSIVNAVNCFLSLAFKKLMPCMIEVRLVHF